MDIQRRRMCGFAEVHYLVLEITDEFLCATDTIRGGVERDWRAKRRRHHNFAVECRPGYSLLF